MFTQGHTTFSCLQLMKLLSLGLTCHHLICRYMRIYVQALSKDYVAALLGVSSNIKRIGENVHDLVDRAVLKRLSGDLQGALDDLNATLPFASGEFCYAHEHNMIEHQAYKKSVVLNGKFCYFHQYDIFSNRGYMKYLMGNNVGATRDSESAQQQHMLRQSRVVHYVDMRTLRKQPMKYLNFSFSLGYLISLCKSR